MYIHLKKSEKSHQKNREYAKIYMQVSETDDLGFKCTRGFEIL